MTYLEFLLRWLAPPLALAAVAVWASRRRLATARTAFGALGAYTALAVAWTTPWDSWLIAHDVWRHGDVAAKALRVPLEEYLFMMGQSLLVGFVAIAVLARVAPAAGAGGSARWVGGIGWGAAAVAAWAAHPVWSHGFYLTAIVGWFGPLLALQWALGGDRLAAHGRARAWAVALPTAYLWAVDLIAIRAGTWWINPDRTLGLRPFGLPLEEAVFFLVTTMLLVNGMILALDAEMWRRAARWLRRAAVTADA
ncbi:lycopene cyclase domain-containing protein [Luedemannella helvata]|uniref:Lycopene cyclase domain-containing protein n=1 Tax=Luedemannella helvata TaxID=349315 RepID=A0ABN2JQY3_9ACTN